MGRNTATLIISTIIKHVMSSAAEEEIGSVFLKAKEETVYGQHWKKWGIRSHPHHYKLTTQHPQVT
jgi:hypothetical protein